MKIVKFYATTLAVFVLALFIVQMPAFAQNLKGNGNLKSETRNVSGFKGIDVGGGFTVELVQGKDENVRIEADENLLSNIKTDVKNGVLRIYNDKSLSTSKGLKAYITVKQLNSIEISGGVKLIGKSTFKADAFKLDLSGGSKVNLAIDTKNLTADMSGASKVELTGKADELSMNMSGASNVSAQELEAKRVKIEASGASRVKVYARESLDITASGASAVYYKGSPRITADTSAAARISKL
ncbi:head GIN domain-containing protein [Pontibacter vulgaris]|uniref:head GIN domain-containing protein n=1 Tax=Pontibacter vulgaris TaxID=2905679 RepID=UPI001FA74A10|nr:head GIN domain-containing protein [Pontibacter vulgaris]